MQRNFILTDVMKTGDHHSYEQFIDTNTLSNQTFTLTGEYYTLHNYDLETYDRKFAMIDMRIHNNRLIDNSEYKQDLMSRLALLHQQGFKFILANPWESMENIKKQIFVTGERMKKVDIPYPYFIWTGGVSWFWNLMYHKHKEKKFNFTHDHNGSYWHKIHEFLYLNKAKRPHRIKLYDKLIKSDVLDSSLYTFTLADVPVRLPQKYELPGVKPEEYPRWGLDQEIYELPYVDTVCSIISETNDTNDEVFMTEKIWKAIMAQHVFIVHGNYLYLQKLKEMGFKTFSNHFDESYDIERDPDRRIDKIVSLCQDLKDSSRERKHGHKKWQDLYLRTKALRQHNYDTMFDKEKLSKQINKTLELFLEFADSSQVSS